MHIRNSMQLEIRKSFSYDWATVSNLRFLKDDPNPTNPEVVLIRNKIYN